MDFTALVVPGFLFFVAFEYFLSKLQKKEYLSYESSVINISVGIAERTVSLFILGVFYKVFEYVQIHFGLFDIPKNIFTTIVLFIAVDFVWYWYHRLGHEVNIFWSAHIVHHQSEEFNYTVSARITIFQALLRNAFWCVLPLLGFSADSIAICLLIHGIYPFFIHTRTIAKLGLLEHILVTPSHHRVHHASNEIYLDKNYGDVLIVWDKLFGTFREETEAPVYGLTKPLESHGFLWQHFHQPLELIYAVIHEKGLQNKFNLIFGRPSEIPSGIRERIEHVFLTKRIVQTGNKQIRLRRYITGQILVALLLLFVLSLLHKIIDLSLMISATVFIVLTLVNCCAILEQKRWVFYPECARAMLLLFTAGFYFPHPVLWMVFLFLSSAVFYYFEYAERQFMRLLYGW